MPWPHSATASVPPALLRVAGFPGFGAIIRAGKWRAACRVPLTGRKMVPYDCRQRGWRMGGIEAAEG